MQTNLYKEFKQFIQGIKKQNNNKNADFEPGEKDPLRQLGEKKKIYLLRTKWVSFHSNQTN